MTLRQRQHQIDRSPVSAVKLAARVSGRQRAELQKHFPLLPAEVAVREKLPQLVDKCLRLRRQPTVGELGGGVKLSQLPVSSQPATLGG